MFEKIVLHRSDQGNSITAGELAEALLYYQNVHLILDYTALNSLNSSIGLKTLLKLLQRPNVSAVFCEDVLATKSDKKKDGLEHSFITYTFKGSKESGFLKSRKQRLQVMIQRWGYEKREAKKLAERLSQKIPTKKLNSDYFINGGIHNAAFDDLQSERFVSDAVSKSLLRVLPSLELPEDFFFKVTLSRPFNKG